MGSDGLMDELTQQRIDAHRDPCKITEGCVLKAGHFMHRPCQAENVTMTPATKPVAIQPDGGGLRKDDGKNRLDLIPPEWIWGLGAVLTQGAEKYAVRNWERGMSWAKMVGCGCRHVFKFTCGERYDQESGCHHLLHAAWNFLSLMTYDIRGIGTNDLPTFDGMAGLLHIAAVMDPEHPRTKKLLAQAQETTQTARAAYEAKS